MEQYKRISDEEVFKALDDLKNEDEQALGNALRTLLLVTLDTRQFLRKMYKNLSKKQKVYKQPTDNKKDIIVGSQRQIHKEFQA